MKKFLFAIAFMAVSMAANAFEFDGIDLNMPFVKVSQEIAKRGYVYNDQRNCLQGDCQGKFIYMSINYTDVSQPGRLGQLVVEFPVEESVNIDLDQVTTILNILYHHAEGAKDKHVYVVDKDGTQLAVNTKPGYIVLTYNTPYYKLKEKK